MADNSALRRQWDRSRHDGGRAALSETLVRACLVIVDQELLDYRLQVAGPEDQLVVEQLAAGCKNERLRDRVRPRRLVGQPQDFHVFGAEDLIEGGGELAVAIAEQELGLHGAVLELPGQVPGLLYRRSARCGAAASEPAARMPRSRYLCRTRSQLATVWSAGVGSQPDPKRPSCGACAVRQLESPASSTRNQCAAIPAQAFSGGHSRIAAEAAIVEKLPWSA